MKRLQPLRLDFFIDKLTNSIENVQSGDTFPTDVSLLTLSELKSITKKNGWRFNWNNEIKFPERDVFKLTIVNNPNIIEGIISLEVKSDHVYMHLIERTPFNIGEHKTLLRSVRKSGGICMQTFISTRRGRLCFICCKDKTY